VDNYSTFYKSGVNDGTPILHARRDGSRGESPLDGNCDGSQPKNDGVQSRKDGDQNRGDQEQMEAKIKTGLEELMTTGLEANLLVKEMEAVAVR
jgi:hypothetical protein